VLRKLNFEDTVRLLNGKLLGNGSAQALCPSHADHNPSLSIGRGDDGRVLLKCHAGCDFNAVVTSLGLNERDLMPPKQTRAEIKTVYDYHGHDGTLLFQVVRYEPKGFRQRRPDGSEGWIWNLKNTTRVPYRFPQLHGREAVVVCEGEKDCDRLWQEHIPATTNAGGSGKWDATHTKALVDSGVKRIAILPDNDEPGRTHANKVATSCVEHGLEARIVTLPDVPEKGDVSDFLRSHTVDELKAAMKATPRFTVAAPPTDEPASESAAITCLADVQRESVEWMWDSRIPRGKLSIIAGQPGEGKSTVTLDLAARITRGATLPDGCTAPQGSVLLLSAEDGLADTIRPRLDAAGADSTRVHALTAIKTLDGARPVNLANDLPCLREAMDAVRPILVVVDPLSAYLGKTDSWKDAEVRSVLSPLAELANERRCAITAVMHFSKATGQKPINKILGSVGFAAAARVVLGVGSDPDNAARRFLLPVKNNLAPAAATLAFTLDDGRVIWEPSPVTGVTADSILDASSSDSAERTDAERFLRDLLADGSPVPAAEVTRHAREIGISPRTLHRAKARLGVKSERSGYGSSGRWSWHLPSKTDTETLAINGNQCPPFDPTKAFGDNKGCQKIASRKVATNN